MSDDDLAFRPLLDISEDLRRRVLSSAKVTEAQLARIARLDDEYHSYATVLAERALAQAHRADAELARGIWRGPLHGVPIAVKDLVYILRPTAGGTAIHRDFVPPYSATSSNGSSKPEPCFRQAGNDRGRLCESSERADAAQS